MEEFDVFGYIKLGKDLGLVGKDLLRYLDDKEAKYYEREAMMLDIECEQCETTIREMLVSLRMLVDMSRKEDARDSEMAILRRNGHIVVDGNNLQNYVAEQEVIQEDVVTEMVEDNVPGMCIMGTNDDVEVLVGSEVEEDSILKVYVNLWKGNLDGTLEDAHRLMIMNNRNVGYEEFLNSHHWDEFERPAGTMIWKMDWDHG